MKPKILLIIPAFNEEKSLEKTLAPVLQSKYDYIVINDGSTDRTCKILEKNHYNHINLIASLGIGGAVQTGYKYAKDNNYDIAIQFDADGQHDLNSVDQLIIPILSSKANFVIGSRFVNKSASNFKSSALRRVGIRLISNFIYLLSRKRIYDTTSGFRAADKSAISYFADNYPREYPEPVSSFELIKLRYKIAEVPVTMHKRSSGKSSIHSYKSAYYVLNVMLSILIVQLRRNHHA